MAWCAHQTRPAVAGLKLTLAALLAACALVASAADVVNLQVPFRPVGGWT